MTADYLESTIIHTFIDRRYSENRTSAKGCLAARKGFYGGPEFKSHQNGSGTVTTGEFRLGKSDAGFGFLEFSDQPHRLFLPMKPSSGLF